MVEVKKVDQKTYEQVAVWLEQYYSTTDKYKKTKLKALIVTKMLPIIKRIARTIARREYDPVEDLVQAGAIGLLKAIEFYSSQTNDNFKIYAGYLIIGEMKHYLRDKLTTIRVPRHIQELSYRINTFTQTLTMEELNELTNDDVAEALCIPKKDVDFVLQADRRKTTLSLDVIYAADSENLGYEEIISKDNYKQTSDFEDMKIVLKDVIEKLPAEMQKIVKLYYYEDLNQKEIAAIVGINQMQVSRQLKRAFSKLYKMIADSNLEV